MLPQPIHHAILVVDIERFSDQMRADLHRSTLQAGFFTALEHAFYEADIDWKACSMQPQGDGALVLIPARFPEGRIIDRLPARLTAQLRRHNSNSGPEGRIRVRFALHSGPVDSGKNGATSTPVIDACRLVDAEPVRLAHRESGDLVTVVVSDRFFTETLSHEPAAEPERYQQVNINVKTLHTTAWIRRPDSRPDAATTTEWATRTTPPPPPTVHDLITRLVEALSGHDETARMRLLSLLPNWMAFGVPYNLDPLSFSEKLALASSQHEQGTGQLLGALRELEVDLKMIRNQAALQGPTPPFGNDAQLLRHLPPGLDSASQVEAPADVFPLDQRTELLTMLANVVIPDIVDLYRASGGPDAPDVGRHSTYPRILDALEALNARPDGIPRTLVLVEHIATRADAALKIRLLQWSSARAAEMGLVEELAAVRKDVRAAHAAPPAAPTRQIAYLVLQLERVGPTGDDLVVKSWRQCGDSTSWAPRRDVDKTCSLAEAKTHVATLIEQAEDEWSQRQPDVLVEFVLDTPDLTVLDVDQWPWENDDFSEPIGTRYIAVVRSAERTRSQKYHREWRRRWTDLTTQLNRTGRIDPVCAIGDHGGDDHGVRRLVADLHKRPDVVAVVLSTPPRPETAGRDPLAVTIKAGVPLVLFHRTRPSSEFAAAFEELLHDAGNPHHLLERVQRARISAYAKAPGEDHLGTALTVLYDDPNRPITPHQAAHPIEEGEAG
ncbi:hypothetical protein [Umezawaea sp. NPDC059074]|uniref:VMAP-C domain-containing protein n=1 Tax=Umezawaea sp. NPDC059074 TaxID=3346716 RepID=UPI0036C4293D